MTAKIPRHLRALMQLERAFAAVLGQGSRVHIRYLTWVSNKLHEWAWRSAKPMPDPPPGAKRVRVSGFATGRHEVDTQNRPE